MKKLNRIIALAIIAVFLSLSMAGAATITKGLIGEQDQNKWDGVTSTFTRATSTGGTLTLNKVGYEVDALMSYGGGVNYTRATIAAALAAIGTTNKATLVLRPETWVIDSNVDWSAYTNVTFKVVPGAVISHGAFSVKLPFPQAGRYQILSGTGNVTFYGSHGTWPPEWWGVTMDGVDSSTAMQKCATDVYNSNYEAALRAGGVIELSAGILYSSLDMLNKPFVSFKGQGPSSTTWKIKTQWKIGGTTKAAPQNFNMFVEDIKFMADNSATNPFLIQNMSWFDFNRVWFEAGAATTKLLDIDSALVGTFDKCIFRGVGAVTDYVIDIHNTSASFDTKPNVLTFRDPVISGGKTKGLRFQNGNMLRIMGGDVEGNPGGGIHILNACPIGDGIAGILDGVHFENNGGKHIEIGAPAAAPALHIIRGVNTLGGSVTADYGLYVDGASYSVQDSSFQGAGTKDVYVSATASGYGDRVTATSASILGTGHSWRPYPAGAVGSLLSANAVANQPIPLTGATPSVARGSVFIITQTGATNVTNFTNGISGMVITIFGGDSNSTIKNGATIVTGTGSDVSLTANMVKEFVNISDVWYMK